MSARWLPLVAVLAYAAWSRPAHAQLALGFDASGAALGSVKDKGGSLQSRFGFRFGLPRRLHVHTVLFQPELVVGNTYLSRLKTSPDHVFQNYHGAGMRLGFALPLSLDLLGYAHVMLAFGSRGTEGRWDYGAALDYRPVSWSLGAHAERVFIFEEDRPRWWQFGVHFEHHWFSW